MEKMTALLARLRPAIERLGGGGHEGEDLFGDVALACVEKYDRYDWSHPKIEGRVLRIAKNLHIRRLRSERVRKCASLPAHDCRALAHYDVQLRETDVVGSWSCQEALAGLPPLYRRVLHEHLVKGKRLVKIASELNLPSATIRTHHRRGLKQLARDLEMQELAANGGFQL